MFHTSVTYNSQYIVDLLRQTDLLAQEEKDKLISFMPNFSQEEKNLLGNQIVDYERKKAEILKDAEEQKKKIEEEYYRKIDALHAEEQRKVREELRRREEAEAQKSEDEANSLLGQM
ncbi:hypothetical protein COW46_03080 [Candidatus Gracilibacteria bacterium CG17_big_fil_post_rev_8_21_14_2_50_48_13]|nr:MAG: hypothetical protein COW46_03080 [Candidatus Gracilibacteria bacterium CG17_big_fil_post_rev_8_21_14_2_50_48_13]